jgi:hypothetical protein
VREIRDDVRKVIATYGRKRPRFVLKFATVQPDVPLLQEIFPDAKFVNIVRDGRDVAHSLLKLNALSNVQLERISHPLLKRIVPYPRVKRLAEYVERFGADSIECTARVWRDTLDLIEGFRPKLAHYHEFRYEDLLADPETELRRLFRFLEWTYPESAEFRRLRAGIGRTSHANRYGERARVESVCAPVLQRYGYGESRS